MGNYLVTGGSSGIGKEIGLQLAKQGNQVILVGRNMNVLEAICKEYSQYNIIPISYNLMDLNNIENIFLFCKEKEIKLDGLVHSAGVSVYAPIGSNDIDDMKEMMTVNCMAFAELVKFFSKKKYSNDGSGIVVISSMASQVNTIGGSIYAASKNGVNSIVKVAAKELLKRKIRVNGVMPSFVNTRMVQDMVDMDRLLEEQPLGIIEPEDVAKVVTFLLSDDARMITGVLLPINGGKGI